MTPQTKNQENETSMKTEQQIREELQKVRQEIMKEISYNSNLNAWESALLWVLKDV